MRRVVLVGVVSLILSGCNGSNPPPATIGEFNSGFSYVPLDPLPVTMVDGPHCGAGHPHQDLYKDLPDNTIRIAVQQLDASGNLGFGPAQVGGEGHTYRVVMDFVNTNVANTSIAYTPPVPAQTVPGKGYVAPQAASFTRLPQGAAPAQGQQLLIIPVYVGVGVRLTADVRILKGNVNLSGLGSLMAAANAQQLSGTLVAQTLGVTGPKVIAALPLPNKIDETTIENSILAMGAIKALIWSGADTWQTVRVTGIYNPIKDADQDTINRIVSQLANQNSFVEWHVDCP